MKIGNKGLKMSRYALSIALLSVSPLMLAQQDDDGYFMDDGSDVYNSEQINIDANYQRRESAADRIAQMRKKLEQENEEMVQKKIEDIRIEQEQELAGRLKSALSGEQSLANDELDRGYDRYDDVSVVSAAPQRVEAVLEDEENDQRRNKIIPTIGARQYDGETIDAFESSANVGLTIENMLTNYFSLGLGVGYTTMNVTYIDNRNFFNFYNQFNYFSTTSDEISYRNINLNVNAKLFLSANTTVKPFVGGMLGYNRTTLAFDQRDQQQFGFGYNLEEASVTASHATATGMIGAEVDFSDNIGMSFDVRYTRNLNNGFDQLNRTFTGDPSLDDDRRILNDIGNRLENADIASINLGLLVKF